MDYNRRMTDMGRVLECKARVLAAVQDASWLRGVGLARVDGRVGVLVSVQSAHALEAESAIEALDLDVPVRVREVRNVRARSSETHVDSENCDPEPELGEDSLESDVSGATSQNASDDAALLKQLREMAAKRLDRSR